MGIVRKRKSKRLKYLVLIASLLMVLFFSLLWAHTSHSRSAVVYKKPRPKKQLDESRGEPKRPYGSKEKTDPFLSYLIKTQRALNELEEERKKKLAEEQEERKRQKLAAAERLRSLREPKTDLQKLDLSQLTLTAIIKAKDQAWAMVRDKKGTGYILKKGTHVGTKGGVVEMIVLEANKTPFGKAYTRKVIIQEPYLYKEISIRYKPVEMEMVDQDYMTEPTE